MNNHGARRCIRDRILADVLARDLREPIRRAVGMGATVWDLTRLVRWYGPRTRAVVMELIRLARGT